MSIGEGFGDGEGDGDSEMVGDGTGVRVGDGVGDGVGVGVRQLQGAEIAFAGPIKLKVALAGHVVGGTVTVTGVLPPGGN